MKSKKVLLIFLLLILVTFGGYSLYSLFFAAKDTSDSSADNSTFGDLQKDSGEFTGQSASIQIKELDISRNNYNVMYIQPRELKSQYAYVSLECESRNFRTYEKDMLLHGTCINPDCSRIGGECVIIELIERTEETSEEIEE